MRVSSVGTKGITTIEGLSADAGHPLQRAWIAEAVPQCGYCQSGQIMQAASLLAQTPDPTDEQINALVAGIRSKFGKHVASDVAPPGYSMVSGDPRHGAGVYDTYCLSCHGAAGQGGSHGGSIVDGSFLNLVSDQYLRTIVIAGRPELGAPDWRGNVPGRPMSPQDVADVVAWLSSQRRKIAISSGTKSPTGGI